jgi:hypothetical protein
MSRCFHDAPLFPLGVRGTDESRHLHSGVRVDNALDVDGADPLSTGPDDILRSVGDPHVTEDVDGYHISGRKPSVSIELGHFVAEIAFWPPNRSDRANQPLAFAPWIRTRADLVQVEPSGVRFSAPCGRLKVTTSKPQDVAVEGVGALDVGDGEDQMV